MDPISRNGVVMGDVGTLSLYGVSSAVEGIAQRAWGKDQRPGWGMNTFEEADVKGHYTYVLQNLKDMNFYKLSIFSWRGNYMMFRMFSRNFTSRNDGG